MMDIVISLGGSVIVPEGIDVAFLKEFRGMVLDYAGRGNRVAVIAGGGSTCRKYNSAAKEIADVSAEDLDWMGIQATILNAELVRAIFSGNAYEKVVTNPNSVIKTEKRIIVGSGWKPGCSSDRDAVLLAKNLGINTVVNLTNIDYVFDKDPKKFSDAQPIKAMSWERMQEIVGKKWVPGANLPFDPVATRDARKLGLKVVIMRGTDLANFRNFMDGKEFRGTVIN